MRPRTANILRGPACDLNDVIKYGFFQQVRILVHSGLVNLEKEDAKRRTPIIQCAFLEPEEWGVGIARILIENGVDTSHTDKFGRNVLHYACIYERKNLAEVLFKAIDFDLNQQDKFGNTALHYAAMSGNTRITKLVTFFLKRYRIQVNNLNKRNKTAEEEARCFGNIPCAEVIQIESGLRRTDSGFRDVRFSDNVFVTSEELTDLNLSPLAHTERQFGPRPKSAAVFTRRDSSCSQVSLEDRKSLVSSQSRSSFIPRPSSSVPMRKSRNVLYNLGFKNKDELIYCAAKNDFRNTPEYVFKMIHCPLDKLQWSFLPSNEYTCRNNTSRVPQISNRFPHESWRNNFKQLFQVYENQCSSSWRVSIKPSFDCLPNGEPFLSMFSVDEEEEKGKTKKRQGSTSRQGREQVPELKRRQSVSRFRKLSSIVMNSGGSLNVSSESINNPSLVNKKKTIGETTKDSGRSHDSISEI